MSLVQRVGRLFGHGDAGGRPARAALAVEPGDSVDSMTAFLIDYIPAHTKFPQGTQLTPDSVLTELGLDSLSMIRLSGQLEQRLAVSIAPELLFEASTLSELAALLHEARQSPGATQAEGAPA